MPRHVRGLARGLGQGMLELVWPTQCLGCDTPGELLCEACREALPAIGQEYACPHCGAPFGFLVCTECNPCLEREGSDDVFAVGPPTPRYTLLPDVEAACAYGVHAWPLDRMVRAYKDHGERRAASLLADLLAQAIGCNPRLRQVTFDALTYVPASHEALVRRGFDHMSDVADVLAAELGVPVARCLRRGRTRDQRGLTRQERAGNVAGMTECVLEAPHGDVLLIDDVMTTGATLQDAARALRQAGEGRVYAAVVARALGTGFLP